jgi:hypothetical protein
MFHRLKNELIEYTYDFIGWLFEAADVAGFVLLWWAKGLLKLPYYLLLGIVLAGYGGWTVARRQTVVSQIGIGIVALGVVSMIVTVIAAGNSQNPWYIIPVFGPLVLGLVIWSWGLYLNGSRTPA